MRVIKISNKRKPSDYTLHNIKINKAINNYELENLIGQYEKNLSSYERALESYNNINFDLINNLSDFSETGIF